MDMQKNKKSHRAICNMKLTLIKTLDQGFHLDIAQIIILDTDFRLIMLTYDDIYCPLVVKRSKKSTNA